MVSFLQNKSNHVSIYQYLHDKTFEIIITHTEILVFFTDIKPLKTYLPKIPMLLRPVLPHIIGRDFIIRPTHFTNCQNVKPTTARIAHIPSVADRHEKNEISRIGLLSQ